MSAQEGIGRGQPGAIERAGKAEQRVLLVVYAAVLYAAAARGFALDLAVAAVLAAALLWSLTRSPHPASWLGLTPERPLPPVLTRLHGWLARPPQRYSIGATLVVVTTLVYGEALVHTWSPPRGSLGVFVAALIGYSLWSSLEPSQLQGESGERVARRWHRLATLLLWLVALGVVLWLSHSAEQLAHG